MTSEGKRSSERSDSGDALLSYLSDVGHYPPLDPETQDRLGGEIDAALRNIEFLLGRLGFAAAEYLRMISEVLEARSNPADFFLYSSLCEGNQELPADLNVRLTNWKEKISKAFCALQKAAESGKECQSLRKALQESLQLYRINGMMVSELYQTADSYAALNEDSGKMMAARFLMTPEEAQQALKELRSAHAKAETLRQRMAEANLRLVISIAQRYKECGVPMGDVIQEGNLGLMLAIERFDYKLGNKFSTYAGWWIKHHILRAIGEQARVIRLPLHMVRAIQNLNRAEQRIVQTLGREPEVEELAAALEMPLARVSALRKMAAQTLSLQAQIGSEDDDTVLEEIISSSEGSEPWREYAGKLLRDKIYQMLDLLTERERQIIVYRFGLCGEPALSLTEISRRVNLSRERVRQLESRIIEQLRTRKFLDLIDGLSHLEE